MAALDPGRERAEQLALRRIDLQIMRHESSIVESEIEIEQKRDEIERFTARIAETRRQIDKLKTDRQSRLEKTKESSNG